MSARIAWETLANMTCTEVRDYGVSSESLWFIRPPVAEDMHLFVKCVSILAAATRDSTSGYRRVCGYAPNEVVFVRDLF